MLACIWSVISSLIATIAGTRYCIAADQQLALWPVLKPLITFIHWVYQYVWVSSSKGCPGPDPAGRASGYCQPGTKLCNLATLSLACWATPQALRAHRFCAKCVSISLTCTQATVDLLAACLWAAFQLPSSTSLGIHASKQAYCTYQQASTFLQRTPITLFCTLTLCCSRQVCCAAGMHTVTVGQSSISNGTPTTAQPISLLLVL